MISERYHRVLQIKAAILSLVIASNLFGLQAFSFNMYSGRGFNPSYIVTKAGGTALLVSAYSGKSYGLESFTQLYNFSNLKRLAFFTNQISIELCDDFIADTVKVNLPNFKEYTC